MSESTVTLSDTAKSVATLTEEMDRLFAESAKITTMQQGLLEAFIKEMRVLSNDQLSIAAKIVAVESLLASLVRVP